MWMKTKDPEWKSSHFNLNVHLNLTPEISDPNQGSLLRSAFGPLEEFRRHRLTKNQVGNSEGLKICIILNFGLFSRAA